MATSCPLCGHLLAENSRFCISCGSPIQPAQTIASTGPTTALSLRCAQPLGLLVPHHCGQPARSGCRVCGQPFCDQHLTIDAHGPICAACAGGDTTSNSTYYDSSDLAYFDRVSERERGEDFADVS